MFKKFRYYRLMKKQNALYMNELLEKACKLANGLPDIVALTKKAKDLDINELQKLIVSEIVEYVKVKEENETVEKDEAVGK